jgi:hypothetical protein
MDLLSLKLDAILLAFLKENMLTVGLFLAFLKVLANETPWAIDNKILQIFTEFRNRNK